jgi:chromosome segregation and condensation protein ScpB
MTNNNTLKERALGIIANICFQAGKGLNSNELNEIAPQIETLIQQAKEEERKRSAKIVEEMMEDSEYWQPIAKRILDDKYNENFTNRLSNTK